MPSKVEVYTYYGSMNEATWPQMEWWFDEHSAAVKFERELNRYFAQHGQDSYLEARASELDVPNVTNPTLESVLDEVNERWGVDEDYWAEEE